MNWDSKVGPHSCSFNVDWLKKHDYTTPQLRVEKMEQEEPLFAVSDKYVVICEIVLLKNNL